MRRVRVLLAVAGAVLLARGVLGTFTDPNTHLVSELTFLVTVLIGHDAVVLPLAIVVGAVLARWAPPPVRGPVRGGLYASAVVIVVALPFVIGAGAIPDNPSALPLDYGHGLLVTLTAVWIVVGGVLGYRLLAARRAGSGHDDGRR